MLSPTTQLLQRNQALFEQGNWLLVNPEDGAILDYLEGDVRAFHQYWHTYREVQSDPQHDFGLLPPRSDQYDGIIVFMPKAKAHAQMLLAYLSAMVKADGCLMLVGENKSGVKSAPKLLAGYGHKAIKLDGARHCSLYSIVVSKSLAAFSLADWESQFEIKVGGHSLTIYSLPGVFNHGKLDEGTRLLLEHIKYVPAGPVLDFACGAGIVGSFLAKLNAKATVTLSDTSAIALYCAEQTAALNQLSLTCIASDGLKDINQNFAAIYTNPPFHTGTKTDYSITRSFLSSAATKLGANGSLTLVANAFLDYPELMETAINAPQILAHTSRFKVYFCRK